MVGKGFILSLSKDEDIVCTPRNRGGFYTRFKIVFNQRREDRSELTSGVPAVLPKAMQGSYVGNG
ncbi:hypothetical protein A2727_01605 [Candidatus Nomurabacteria bacterium RIFCSPHIGHO2_01_FULL_37_110]|nr:MAG: hypothetical protein A2727_01605 [Candidatus Nomurabacteria bacterium RIFCSPHIGHO2_01_FULL_37_110]OGI84339.1 MAG: hypothetical protein A3A92_02070 [Candidatus Nomurabacteria bacterium RIFCSPLOWO2_01_FULL_37_49]